jgi:predicted sulfurtransferase
MALKLRKSYGSQTVFHRLQVRVKAEIVPIGAVPLVASTTNTTAPFKSEAVSALQALPASITLSSYLLIEQPALATTGNYVAPGVSWDALLDDPDCWVIDARNDYEVELGTFRNAINPHTAAFTEFPTWLQGQLESSTARRENDDGAPDQSVDAVALAPSTEASSARAASPCTDPTRPRKIAMFCTGGIRCEKATAYCLQLLSTHETMKDIPVYHLEGGILAYLDTVPPAHSSFEGECFVFDQRVAVTHGLHPTQTYTACHACRHPVSRTTMASDPRYVVGTSCPHCYVDNSTTSDSGVHCAKEDDASDDMASRDGENSTELGQQRSLRRLERHAERQRQMELAAAKGITHIHDGKQTQFVRRPC